MPVYEFFCPGCHAATEELLPIDHELPYCVCGREMVRSVSRATFQYGDGVGPDGEQLRERHKAWLAEPETQAKIKSGELVPATSRPEDHPFSTSSVTERAKLGIL